MTRAGLIGAAVIFVLALGLSFVSGLIVPCCAIIVGIAAGYLAGMWERPNQGGLATQRGALAGAIAGVGAVVGQSIGAVANAAMLGPTGSLEMMQQLGVDVGNAGIDPTMFYLSSFGTGCCLGVFSLVLMAGLGALGGVIWWQTTGKNQGGALAA